MNLKDDLSSSGEAAKPPRASFGLPVYNGGPFLRETLDSLVNQDCGDFELIICDNASTDDTEDICQAYAAGDSRIRYYRNEKNMGAAWNYNRVFELSRAKYFKWTAADDPVDRRFLGSCADMLDSRPDAALCYPLTKVIDLQGEPMTLEADDLELDTDDIIARFTRCMDPMSLRHNPVFGLMRRDALARTHLIGPYLSSDRCLMAELSLQGKFSQFPEPLIFRRKHSANIGTRPEHLKFYAPHLDGRIVLPEWRVMAEHFGSISRVDLPRPLKLKLVRSLAKWAWKKRGVLAWQVRAAAGEKLRRCLARN